VNAHRGNQHFRSLCFSRKPAFDAANHAGKRRIAKEIVAHTISTWGSRFLKMGKEKGTYYEMNSEQAIHKACQVMRDHRRPDRAERDAKAAESKKKKGKDRAPVTPVDLAVLPPPPAESVEENPFGEFAHIDTTTDDPDFCVLQNYQNLILFV